MSNPHLDIEPNYAQPEFAEARNIFTEAGKTNEEATALLTEVWRFNHQRACDLWDQERRAEQEARQQHAREEEQAHAAQEQEQRLALQEECKKYKNKFVPIPNCPLPAHSTFLAPQIALSKLRRGEYVPLYYFTNKGKRDLEQETPDLDNDVLSLARTAEGDHVWQSAAATKVKSCKVPDEDITWEEFGEANFRMLEAMEQEDWDPARVDMMREFWLALEGHEFRHGECQYAKKALLVYQARIRRQWHQTIATRKAFSLIPLSELRLHSIQKELMDAAMSMQIETLKRLNARASTSTGVQATTQKPTHTRSFSASKRLLSPSSPAGSTNEPALAKKARSFRAENPQPAHGTKPGEPVPGSLPVCAVCLGREKHDIPVIACCAKRTWDNLFDTLCERVNKALRIRETGDLVCSFWQKDSGCSQKHDHKHACSGCLAATHGASQCPRAQKQAAANSI